MSEDSIESDVLSALMRASDDKRMDVLEHVLKGILHERVRDFIVAEAIEKIRTPCIVIHVPSGHWKGFSLPYDQALQMLKDRPEADGDLLESIFAV